MGPVHTGRYGPGLNPCGSAISPAVVENSAAPARAFLTFLSEVEPLVGLATAFISSWKPRLQLLHTEDRMMKLGMSRCRHPAR